MKLFYAEVMNPRKACAVAKYLNSPVELVHVDLAKGEHKTPQFLAINPNGKVPALEDGATKLWEADAIMCHLACVAGSDLWPSDDERKIDVIRWLSWNAVHFTQHAGAIYFEYIIKPMFGIGEPDAAAANKAIESWRPAAAVLNEHLRGRKYLVGDTLSVADFSVGIALPYAEKAHIPLGDFPEIARWHDRLNELPAWREPFPAAKARAA